MMFKRPVPCSRVFMVMQDLSHVLECYCDVWKTCPVF